MPRKRGGDSGKSRVVQNEQVPLPSGGGVPESFKSDKERVEYLKSLNFADREHYTEQDVVNSLKRFTGSGYSQINYGYETYHIKRIDDFIKAAPKSGDVIYRATSVDPAIFREKYAVGKSYNPKHLTSWTTDTETVGTFLGDAYQDHPNNVLIVLRTINKRGAKVEGFSAVPQEKETLHKSTDKFKIVNMTHNDDGDDFWMVDVLDTD